MIYNHINQYRLLNLERGNIMKKVVAVILTLCVLLSLCACSANQNAAETTEPTEPIETINERPLLNDSDNAARAQMNVGKGTIIHGIITDIGTSFCSVRLIFPKNALVYVEMPIEQLAELNANTFISIEGVVSAFDANGNGKYTIRAKQILDAEEMDAWIKQKITAFYNYNGASSSTYSSILGEFDLELLSVYAEISGDMFRINDDAKLSEYLVGEWIYGIHPNYWFDSQYCNFRESGTYVTTYRNGPTKYRDWSVDNGCLTTPKETNYGGMYVGEVEHSYPVYVFGDDIFIYDSTLYIRDK
jgi:hypothetical protein